jgi:hypothetical protein
MSTSGSEVRCSGHSLRRRIHRRIAALAIAVCPFATFASAQTPAPDVAVKAAFLFNFAKFAEWPALAPDAPLGVCIVGDHSMADVLAEAGRAQNIGGRRLDVAQPQDTTSWPACHLLFISGAETERSAGGLHEIKTLPILTVSDGKGFSQGGGIIEFYMEGGRMRFAINVDAADRSTLRLSSRLLGLAKIIRNGRVPMPE